jgi:hypothetical protein
VTQAISTRPQLLFNYIGNSGASSVLHRVFDDQKSKPYGGSPRPHDVRRRPLRMGFLLNALNDLAKGARFAAGAAVWSGHSISRQFGADIRGVCLVCNNLQPYGHEDTFGRAAARWYDREGEAEGLQALRTKASAVATLVLADISPKELLKAREIDKQTGLRKPNCKYCRLLCDIFDAYFI